MLRLKPEAQQAIVDAIALVVDQQLPRLHEEFDQEVDEFLETFEHKISDGVESGLKEAVPELLGSSLTQIAQNLPIEQTAKVSDVAISSGLDLLNTGINTGNYRLEYRNTEIGVDDIIK